MAGQDGDYRIYTDLAEWWPMISPPREYTEEAATLATIIDRAVAPIIGSAGRRAEVLDLGSGGGHVAVHLKHRFSLTLVDISEPMLAVSAQLNPECAHARADMRTVRLGRTFDAVLVHDAIDYIIGTADLRRVVETAAAHCRPGGVALFVPDYVKDTFSELTGAGGGGVDAAGRTASFSERTWDPDPADDWVQADYEFVLRTADGDEKVVVESHRLSAFSRSTWRSLLAEAGFHPDPAHIMPGRQPPNLFVARKPTEPPVALPAGKFRPARPAPPGRTNLGRRPRRAARRARTGRILRSPSQPSELTRK
jgi:SAM-dependent methyltransferase